MEKLALAFTFQEYRTKSDKIMEICPICIWNLEHSNVDFLAQNDSIRLSLSHQQHLTLDNLKFSARQFFLCVQFKSKKGKKKLYYSSNFMFVILDQLA